VASWLGVLQRWGSPGFDGGPQRLSAGVVAGLGRGHEANRRDSSVKGTPPLSYRVCRALLRMTGVLWCIMCREWGAMNNRAWLGLAEESGVWQSQATPGARVGRLGMPILQWRAHSKSALAMVREGLQEGRSSSAADAMEA
jgi:hypothetical protein